MRTTSTAGTVDLSFTNNSISGTAGTLIFSNAAASGSGVFDVRFTGSGFNFSRPIILTNGSFGSTRLNSYNTNGTTQTFSGVISGPGSYLRTASVNGSGAKTIFTGNNSYSGGTTISDGTLQVDNTTGSGTGSGNVTVSSGGTLAGSGAESGNVTVTSGGHTRPGSVTNTIGGNLSYATGAKADFDLTGSTTGSGNGQIILSGTSSVLGGSNVTININCGATLDQATDYVLYQLTGGSATISSNFNATPTWLGTVPANSGSYVVLTDVPNKKVLLHYISATPPTATASASPSTVSRNQSTVLTANVTPGSGTITTVTVDLSSIGGSASFALVQSNSSSLYTNTITVPAGVTAGNKTLLATATDSTPLAGTANIALTVVAGTQTWNGSGTADNWTTNGNWTSARAPGLVGDALIFAGNTRLTALIDTNYSVTGLTFDNTAGSFSISNANGGGLTLTGGVTNNSTSAQMVTAPVVMNTGQTFNTAAGDLIINGIVSGTGAGLTKVGSGVLTLLAANTFDGATTIANGTLQLANPLALQSSALNYTAASLIFSNISAATLGNFGGSQNLSLLNVAASPVALTIAGAGAGATYSGQLSGTGASLTKSGTNTLTLSGNNNYSGGTTVNGGSLILTGNNTISGATTVNSGATLSLSSGSFAPVTPGALNLGTGSTTAGTVTIAVDASFSAATIGGNNNGGSLTISGGNVSLGAFTSVRDASSSTATTTAGLVLSGGTVTATIVTLSSGNSGGDLTVNNPASLTIGNSSTTGGFVVGNGTSTARGGFLTVAGGALTYNGTDGLIINNKSTSQGTAAFSGGVSTLTGITLNNPANTAGNAVLTISGGTVYLGGVGLVVNTPGTATASITLSGGTLGAAANWSSSAALPISNTVTFQAADGSSVANNITLNGTLSGAGVLKKTGTGTLTLAAAAGNTYSGGTLITAGTLLVNNTSASGTGAANVTNGATFGGSGIISGGVTNLAGATLQPGLGGTDTSTLTINNNLTLFNGGTAMMGLNRGNVQNAAKISGVNTLTYGGSLIVTNTGASLLSGDTFVLFAATNYAGNFTNVSLPVLTSGLEWNTNNLTTAGTISVQPSISPVVLLLASSLNPAGFNASVNFTAAVTPTNATGTIIFLTNGAAWTTNNLVSGSATSANISNFPRGTNVITAIYSGDVNYYGATNSLNQIVTNHPPVAGNAAYFRNAGIISLHIVISELLTNVTDVDPDTITLTATSISTNGITIASNGTHLLYQNNNAVNDQFTYTVSDGNGGSATGTITVVAQPFVTGQDATVVVSGSTATVSFAGIPGYGYSVQRSTNLMSSWSTILTTNAPAGGLFNLTDDFNDLGFVIPASAYYRLQWNP